MKRSKRGCFRIVPKEGKAISVGFASMAETKESLKEKLSQIKFPFKQNVTGFLGDGVLHCVLLVENRNDYRQLIKELNEVF